MNACVALEQRFVRLADGSVWTRNQCGLAFWQRYLDVFDHVTCLARVRDVAALDGDWHRADGDGVSVHPVPYYIGAAQFAAQARRVRRAVANAVRPGAAFVLRVPGNLGDMAARRLRAIDYPYGVEVVGDPHDMFSPGAVQHPLRGLIRL
jgi:hypothetical protein